jgi:hypothetical protein
VSVLVPLWEFNLEAVVVGACETADGAQEVELETWSLAPARNRDLNLWIASFTGEEKSINPDGPFSDGASSWSWPASRRPQTAPSDGSARAAFRGPESRSGTARRHALKACSNERHR